MKRPQREVKIHGAFSVPFVQFKFTKHSQYEFPEIDKSVNKPDTWHIPLNTSFPNIPDDDTLVPPRIRDSLKRDLHNDLAEVLKDMNILPVFEMSDFWYNIYHEAQGQEPHDHLSDCMNKNPFWSVIYYNKNASGTMFMRPFDAYRTQEFPLWNMCAINECFNPRYVPDVSDGDVIMFPPYIKHMIQHTEPKMRLTFATNLILKDHQQTIHELESQVKGFG